MKRVAGAILFVGLLLSAAAVAQSQAGNSLADAARANRSKQQAEEAAGATPKVITNQDLPSAPSNMPEFSEPMTIVSGVNKFANSYPRGNQRLLADERTSQYWRAPIANQEERIADLRMRIDHLNQSMRAAVGTAQYNTPANRYESIQMERLAHMQELLDQQQRRLSMMQDAARLTGMGQ